MGHKLSFSAMVYFPYMDYKLSRSDPATTVTLLDSLNVRMIYDFATRLNISFDVREQPERSWGVERGGKFTGMVGELQGEKVDVGAPMGPLAERLNAMDFVNVYKVDFMKILSLKPTLLPEYLSLIRPFSELKIITKKGKMPAELVSMILVSCILNLKPDDVRMLATFNAALKPMSLASVTNVKGLEKFGYLRTGDEINAF
ncbi:uncharacterized protein [Procambarus clarkii]|uniref:uncharacterized protein n=1 Tax=Procambarus clarkii TaxID=6728 RepID=UPI0037422D17